LFLWHFYIYIFYFIIIIFNFCKIDEELGHNLLQDDGGLLVSILSSTCNLHNSYLLYFFKLQKHPEIPPEGREPHESVTTPLQPHQKQALWWMIKREQTLHRGCRGGMLLDDPGMFPLFSPPPPSSSRIRGPPNPDWEIKN
jgi:hypothetical protein